MRNYRFILERKDYLYAEINGRAVLDDTMLTSRPKNVIREKRYQRGKHVQRYLQIRS